jgi:hypothetical protein
MEVSDEVVTVLLVKGHECSSHNDKFNLVGIVTESLELLDSVLRLQIRVISGSNRTHRGWLVPCVALG